MTEIDALLICAIIPMLLGVSMYFFMLGFLSLTEIGYERTNLKVFERLYLWIRGERE